jgi:hypothetical protein
MPNTNTIAKAILSAISAGADSKAVEGPAFDAYGLLKDRGTNSCNITQYEKLISILLSVFN